MHKVLLSAVSGLAFAARAFAAAGQLVQVDHFGPNSTDVAMFVYKPAQLASPPPLIMVMHYCGGTAQAYFTGTQYANLADTHGFIIIYPNSPPDDGCWDVNTNATLTHNAGGDSLGIVSQVRYAIANYGVHPSRVFATGTSSGAMMTNVRMGAYPDVFAAGSAFSGVPYGCFAGQNAWNTQSVNSSRLPKNGCGDLVRSGYPGYTGPRPKFQFWYGTADTTLYLQNFWEDIKQWTNVFNVSQTPTSNITNDPLPGYSHHPRAGRRPHRARTGKRCAQLVWPERPYSRTRVTDIKLHERCTNFTTRFGAALESVRLRGFVGMHGPKRLSFAVSLNANFFARSSLKYCLFLSESLNILGFTGVKQQINM
ncbi:hypothetical protein EWM64_g805, partial [Hericium alpestre]